MAADRSARAKYRGKRYKFRSAIPPDERATGWRFLSPTEQEVLQRSLHRRGRELKSRCWCGEPMGHDWPGKADNEPHPRPARPSPAPPPPDRFVSLSPAMFAAMEEARRDEDFFPAASRVVLGPREAPTLGTGNDERT